MNNIYINKKNIIYRKKKMKKYIKYNPISNRCFTKNKLINSVQYMLSII